VAWTAIVAASEITTSVVALLSRAIVVAAEVLVSIVSATVPTATATFEAIITAEFLSA
jgi:hypothetical protein